MHGSFKQVAAELMQLPLDDAQRAALVKTVAQEQDLYDGGDVRARRSAPRRRLTNELAENAYEVLAISYLVADREVVRLRASAEAVQRQLILLVMFGTAVALAAPPCSFALHRAPHRHELDGSIRQLGDADFSRPIR